MEEAISSSHSLLTMVLKHTWKAGSVSLSPQKSMYPENTTEEDTQQYRPYIVKMPTCILSARTSADTFFLSLWFSKL